MSSLDEFETRVAQLDMGRLAARVYLGAREETDTRLEAVCATVAAIIAMLRMGDFVDDDEDEDE